MYCRHNSIWFSMLSPLPVNLDLREYIAIFFEFDFPVTLHRLYDIYPNKLYHKGSTYAAIILKTLLLIILNLIILLLHISDFDFSVYPE